MYFTLKMFTGKWERNIRSLIRFYIFCSYSQCPSSFWLSYSSSSCMSEIIYSKYSNIFALLIYLRVNCFNLKHHLVVSNNPESEGNCNFIWFIYFYYVELLYYIHWHKVTAIFFGWQALCEKCPNTSFFSGPYSVRMQENTDQKKPRI